MKKIDTTGFCEMSQDEMMDVNGGEALVVIGVVLAVAATIWILYEIGYGVGKAVGHISYEIRNANS